MAFTLNYVVRDPYPGEIDKYNPGSFIRYGAHFPWSHDGIDSRWYLNSVGDTNIVKSLDGRTSATTPSYLSASELRIYFKP